MKTLILISTLFFHFSLQAAPNSELVKQTLESQSDCRNFVRFDNDYLYLGVQSRGPNVAVHVVPLNGTQPFELSTKASAVDLIRDGQTAYVLTPGFIEEWDLTSHAMIARYPTSDRSESLQYQQNARSFVRDQDRLIIAHGRLGLSFFDLKTKSLTRMLPLIPQQAPLESMATGISIQGHKAYIVMDNFHLVEKIFRGIVIYDLDKDTVIAEAEGLDPGVTTVNTDENFLIASYGGNPIWKYDLKAVQGSKLSNPLRRLFKMPVPGHPTGNASMDDKYYYTCYSKSPGPGGGLHSLIPLAIDRASTKL